jgi:hypothetical protein
MRYATLLNKSVGQVQFVTSEFKGNLTGGVV